MYFFHVGYTAVILLEKINRQARCACLKKGESELSLIIMIPDDHEQTVNN